MIKKKACGCRSNLKLIYACSGAADVGAIVDLAARKLSSDGVGKMSCAVGIGGNVDYVIDAAKSAAAILAIDGCDLDCTRKALESAGFTSIRHLRITDLGMEKGNSPVTDENIGKVVEKGTSILSEGVCK